MLPRPASILHPLLLSVALSLAAFAAAEQGPLIKAPQVDTPTRLLFVGNSYIALHK